MKSGRMSDLLRYCVEWFAAESPDTTILIGEKHLDSNEGTGNRVVFVPEDGDPVMAPIYIGKDGDGEKGFASIIMGCSAWCWGLSEYPEVDDLARYEAAQTIEENVIKSIYSGAPGRVGLKKIRRTQDTRLVTYGEEFIVDFTFQYQIGVLKKTAVAIPGGIFRPAIVTRSR